MGSRNVTGVRREKRCGKSIWVVDFRYTDTNGKRRRFRRDATIQLGDAARAEAAELIKRSLATGNPECVEKKHVGTFAEFVENCWSRLFLPGFRPETRIRYEALLGQGILRHFGPLSLDDIGAMQVRSYAIELKARGVQSWPHTSLVSGILRAAVEAGELAEMPTLPSHGKKSNKLPDCPDTDEVEATLQVAKPGWLKTAIALGVYAGLRSGEIRALEVRNLDLNIDMIKVQQAISGKEVCTPKSGHERLVPIAPQLRPILLEAIKDKLPAARVVVTTRGTTPSRQLLLACLHKLQKRHKLQERTIHQLRHSFCTSLLRRGADIEVVRIVAGHEDLKTTARYVHARVDDARRAMAGT